MQRSKYFFKFLSITTRTSTFAFLLICIFSSLALAEKKPKANEATESAPAEEVDPLKKELQPGEIYSCEADIFYEWETISDPPLKNKEFFETLVERGNDGTLSKAQLESRLIEAKDRARNHCRNAHNVPNCTSSKLRAAKNELNLLDFQTKRTLTANLIQGCEDKAGKCLETSNSDLRCQVYRSPDSITKKEAEKPADTAPVKK